MDCIATLLKIGQWMLLRPRTDEEGVHHIISYLINTEDSTADYDLVDHQPEFLPPYQFGHRFALNYIETVSDQGALES